MAHAGERIGAYEVVRLIARGGMATVYEARQPALDRAVALKRLDLRTDDPTLAERFIRESRIAASFDHPNIVTVYDFFECEAVPYIAMEYLPRGSLRPFVGRVSPPQAFGVIEGVLAGLGHAERRGIAHRDLKPENVLVTTGGGVKIADFGIAKAYTNATGNFTAAGVAVGTPAYMAPEQALSRGVGPFTDLYALGVMAYELLGGTPPFEGDGSPMAVMYRHVSEAPPPLAGVDPRLAAWVGRMLEKRPEARPAGAVQAWAELEEVVVDIHGPYWRRDAALGEGGDASDLATTTAEPRAPTARKPPAPTPVQRPRRRQRRRLPMVGAAALLALGGTVAVLAWDGEDGAPPEAAETPAPTAGTTRAAAPFDFDGDGRPTFVVGVTDAGTREAGVVWMPGTDATLEAASPRKGLDFGASVASADFNRDGRADLAVGAPGANDRGRPGTEGAIHLFAGSRGGLSAAPLQLVWSGTAGYLAARFGTALAAGHLNRDKYPDLAVGTPGSNLRLRDGREWSGSVLVAFGGEDGLSLSRTKVIRRPPGVSGGFGSVLAIGDVNRDGRSDLLEGAPGPAGHATYCPGGRQGPRGCRSMGALLPGPAAIAVGNVTGDRYRDVVHGVPAEDGFASAAGAVRVWRGSRDGPTSGPTTISQELPPGVLGEDQADDGFGASVAVARVDRDRFADIVVGAPGENFQTGRIAVLFGAEDGVDETRDTGYSETTPGPLRLLTPGSGLGSSLALLDADGDRRLDLAVTAPGDARYVGMSGTDGGFDAGSATLLNLPGRDAHVGAP